MSAPIDRSSQQRRDEASASEPESTSSSLHVSQALPVDSPAQVAPTRTSPAEISTSSGTIEYAPTLTEEYQHPSDFKDSSHVSSAREDDRTVISQRPVAAPEEFYRSMPLSELAGMLEGRQLDHFAVDQMIGGGGMGAVFRGRDLRLDRVVAIKVIPAARRDPETLRRFRLEAQAAAKLDHPNIARVYYVGEAEQWNYIVFEFIDGVNIRDLVEMEGPLSVDDAVFYARQVAEALQHAYERDVVHRDIKPSNVLVTASGSAKVVDMGLARNTALDRSTGDETASGVTLGTFDYISPEQARNPRDADVRSDLYSLGCTLFYMLTGNPPFPEGTALQKLLSHGSQAPPDPRGWRDDLSDELYEITMKLMAKRPTDRYQTPTELVSDLVMLAEVENLPRSQSPGTMLVPTHTAQASLIESNLPWLVPLTFLLGSTLWLASVQSLTNDMTIAELQFEAKPAVVGVQGAAPSPAVAAENRNFPAAPTSNAPDAAEPSNAGRGNGAAVGVSSAAGETSAAGAGSVQEGVVPSSGLSPVSTVDLPGLDSRPRLQPPTDLPAPNSSSSASPNAQPAIQTNPQNGSQINAPSDLFQPTTPAANGPNNNERTSAETTTRGESLIVSAERPEGVDPSVWESSLATAVARLAAVTAKERQQWQQIELRGRVVLRRPIELKSLRLRIVAEAAGGAAIEVAESLLQGDVGGGEAGGVAVFRLNDARLVIQGVALNLKSSAPAASPRTNCFLLAGSSQLELDSCTVTVRDSTANSKNRLSLIAYNPAAEVRIAQLSELERMSAGSGSSAGGAVSGSLVSGSFNTGNMSNGVLLSGTARAAGENAIVIRSSRCVFRGDASLIKLDFTPQTLNDRADISLSNTLIALSGSALELTAPTSENLTQRFVRLLCEQSTLATEQPFAKLGYEGNQVPSVGLLRSSQSCIYWSPTEVPHVLISGARRQSLLGNFNLLLLQGVSNLYDANIQELCQAYLGTERIATFGFVEASTSGWLAERASESRVRWQDARFLREPWSQATPRDFAVADVLFAPGITAMKRPPGSLE